MKKNGNFIIWVAGMIGFLVLTHIVFSIPAPVKWLESVWSAGDLITFVGTITLGYVAWKQNERANDMNDKLLQLNNLTAKLEMENNFPIVTATGVYSGSCCTPEEIEDKRELHEKGIEIKIYGEKEYHVPIDCFNSAEASYVYRFNFAVFLKNESNVIIKSITIQDISVNLYEERDGSTKTITLDNSVKQSKTDMLMPQNCAKIVLEIYTDSNLEDSFSKQSIEIVFNLRFETLGFAYYEKIVSKWWIRTPEEQFQMNYTEYTIGKEDIPND